MATFGDYSRDAGLDNIKYIRQGEIWNVQDEYLSGWAKKYFSWLNKAKRPVLVISSDEHSNCLKNDFIVVVPIADDRSSEQDVLLMKGVGGTTKECKVQITLFQGIPREAFDKKRGDLFAHQNIMNEIETKIVQVLGFISKR